MPVITKRAASVVPEDAMSATIVAPPAVPSAVASPVDVGPAARDIAGQIVPAHVAIIMDGNGRWAKSRSLPRIAGHREGSRAVRRAVEAAIRSGVSWLTIYAFSSENWRRPAGEIQDLTGLLRRYLRSEIAELKDSGVRLRFEAGLVVDASAERGEEYLLKLLDTDAGARRLGELGIGTNYGIDRGTREVLLDEKIGGTVHMAVGSSYPESGGVNESAVHTDLVCDLRLGGKLEVDGEVMQENGRFLV